MQRLSLDRGRWYGWQMFPGYGSEGLPYFSPIQIVEVTPRRSGDRILTVCFWNIMYADGAQFFEVTLRILRHAETYLVAEPIEDSASGRTVILSEISLNWIANLCPEIELLEGTDVQEALDRTFGALEENG